MRSLRSDSCARRYARPAGSVPPDFDPVSELGNWAAVTEYGNRPDSTSKSYRPSATPVAGSVSEPIAPVAADRAIKRTRTAFGFTSTAR